MSNQKHFLAPLKDYNPSFFSTVLVRSTIELEILHISSLRKRKPRICTFTAFEKPPQSAPLGACPLPLHDRTSLSRLNQERLLHFLLFSLFILFFHFLSFHSSNGKIEIQWNPDFSNPRFFEPPDFSKWFLIGLPWRFEKSGFHCILLHFAIRLYF